jgi:ubiquinone/menaquinone biosynthesis C-methylase UbiE
VADFFAMLVKVIFPPNFVGAKAAVSSLPTSARGRIKNVLDVAAGAGAWSIPFAQANKATRVTVIDFPQVTPVAREYASRFGVSDQYEYREGDLHEVDFGNRGYDLVTLGHVIHAVGREAGQRLIERSAAALRDRGMLLIAEFIPNDDRTGPSLPLLFGLNMMLHSPVGDVFTMKDYRSWLKAAGFKTIKAIRTPAAPSPLILASK